jgi:DNA-binding NarL/FixJ family response regulator
MSITAAVVEDDNFTRLMLVTSLRAQNVNVVIDTSAASSALEFASKTSLDVALLDLHLGTGPTGIDLALSLRKINPRIGIVLLTSYEDPRLLDSNLPALPTGSVYINKKAVSDIKVLMAGINSAIGLKGDGVQTRAKANSSSGVSSLTNTQLETLRLMSKGLSNAEIAKQKFVTERSVEQSIARLAKTMGLQKDATRNQRVHMAKVYFRALGANTDAED